MLCSHLTLASFFSFIFFSNKGEVAGVFTVVSLPAAAILFTAITTAAHRRLAKKFNQEVAQAAMEAATTSRSVNFDDYGYGGNDNRYNDYSVDSHGTHVQPTMSHGEQANEAYVMSDVG
jgi:hypothetical protein